MHAHPSPRSGPCPRYRVSHPLQAALSRAVWFFRTAVSGLLQTQTEESQICPAPARLVCAGTPSRRFRGDVRGMAHATVLVEATLQRLAGAAEVGIHR